MKPTLLKILIALLVISVIVSGCTGIMKFETNLLHGLSFMAIAACSFVLVALIAMKIEIV